jgi:hypothetical protein
MGSLRGRVFELDAALASLANQHRKLQGKFYGTLGAEQARRFEDADLAAAKGLDVNTGLAVCENWSIGQKTGPGSDAAACDCAYCCAMREARHNAKAALVPKGVASRLRQVNPT